MVSSRPSPLPCLCRSLGLVGLRPLLRPRANKRYGKRPGERGSSVNIMKTDRLAGATFRSCVVQTGHGQEDMGPYSDGIAMQNDETEDFFQFYLNSYIT